MASWQTYYGRGKGKCYLGLDVWAQESEVEQQPPLPVGESVFRSGLNCKHVLAGFNIPYRPIARDKYFFLSDM